MQKITVLITICVCFKLLNAKPELVYRSEYEKEGDLIYDINDPREGSLNYRIVEGNENGHYTINEKDGEIRIASPIEDAFGVVQTDLLKVKAGARTHEVKIVDSFDYTLSLLPDSFSVLSKHQSRYVDKESEWTAYNNLWGRRSAVANVDFRIAMLHQKKLPSTCIFIWDVPSSSKKFGDAAVWCYTNLLWGNRPGVREDLPAFPFQIKSIEQLTIEFDYRQLFGNHGFKLAMNLFTYDESHLASLGESDGDFFFVFDQVGTYIPPYPYSLPDIKIMGKPFALRYKDEKNGKFRQRRRVIVKDGEMLTRGRINLKYLFDIFIKENYLNPLQYIQNIQLGIEVSYGYGAIKFNQFDVNLKTYPNVQGKDIDQDNDR